MLGGHWFYLVALIILALLIFGPGRLPELGGAIGKAMREFRKATTELSSEVTNAANAAKSEAQAPAETTAKGSSSEAKPSSN
jgi:sec-independent protein translocase protein TatA